MLLRGEMQCPQNLRHKHAILREAHGLSSAIETIALHNLFVRKQSTKMVGCHSDLEPKDILVKDDKFLLTDFGFELRDTAPQERRVPVQGFYYAPELMEASRGASAAKGIQTDVWSFGCILAMIATFLQYGSSGVAEFVTAKPFHANGQLNPAVQDWSQRIKVDSQSASLSGTVELIRKMLVIDPKARPEISVVTEELFFLAHKAIFEFSCDRFLHLLVQIGSLSANLPVELVTESERYKIWGDTVGFRGEYGDRNRIIDIVRSRNPEITSGISNVLVEIEDELHYIESRSSRRLSPTYIRLRALNDKLWAYMTPELVNGMNQALQSALLDGKITKDLQKISNTSFQSDIPSKYTTKLEAITDLDKRDEFLLRSSNVSIISEFDSHSLGSSKRQTGDNRPALIEWITYSPHWDEKLYSRVPKIARLFSNSTWTERGLRVLQCKGYYRDETKKRFGLVYEIPKLDPKPITLRELIKNTNNLSDRPSLGNQFELARKIVQCVLEVHKVGWVHKSLSSYNIIFLPNTSPEPIPVTLPYLIGFNHSREDKRQIFTEGLVDENQRQYHHPEYLQNDHGFRPKHDYYSVGLILLEIGMWCPLSQLTKRMAGLTLQQRSEELVKECVQNLGNSMGQIYCDAVKACLTSDFGEGGDREGIRDQFEAKVVNRLAKCQA
ncbi:hypothetical protein K440DRAFT_619978 [Wilcoxina mikolae CBS 423.85]|nr:hypothetical protein K440DRAFT_619978 [Wilcoxina mikolae CBS 423.85]